MNEVDSECVIIASNIKMPRKQSLEERQEEMRARMRSRHQWDIPRFQPTGFVYVIGCEHLDYYKIGITYRSLPRIRIAEVQENVPFTIDVEHIFPSVGDPLLTEKLLHQEFKQYRVKGEWFRFDRDTLSSALASAYRLANDLPRKENAINEEVNSFASEIESLTPELLPSDSPVSLSC